MSSILERRYRLLLRSYPPEYLDQHEDEIIATLLDGAKPDQLRPKFRDATELVIAGLRTRARLAAAEGRSRQWSDSMRLAALLLLASILLDRLAAGSDLAAFPATVLVACAVVAVVVGNQRLGVLLAVAAFGGVLMGSRTYEVSSSLHPSLRALWLGPVWSSPEVWMYDDAALVAVAVALGAASIHPGPRRPWPWWLAGSAIVLVFVYRVFGVGILDASNVPHSESLLTEFVLPVALLSSAGFLLHDPRPAFAATIYAVIHLAMPIANAWLIGIPLGPMYFQVGSGIRLTLVLAGAALACGWICSRLQADDLAVPTP